MEVIDIEFRDSKVKDKDRIVKSFILSQILDERNTGAIVAVNPREIHYVIMLLHNCKRPLEWTYGTVHIDQVQEEDLNGLSNYWAFHRLFEIKN